MTGDGDKALALASSGNVRMPDRIVAGSTTETIEAWFSTTSAGPIIGVADAPAGTAPVSFVPVIYVGNDGRLRAQASTGAATPITTTQVVNDGARHHVALVMSSTSQTLYVDGVAVGTLSGTINHLAMNYTYIGASYTHTIWPQSNTTSAWRSFNGTIDEVAVYRTALPAARVTAHFQAGTSSPVTTQSTYYPRGAIVTVPCPGGAAVDQGGRIQLTRGVAAADGNATTTEVVYDTVGRTVASRTNAGAWSCKAYDARGREVSRAVPPFGADAGRTVTSDYAVNGDPFVSSLSDPVGTITSTADWLGRRVAYADVWGNLTTTTYDQVGRVTDATGPRGAVHTDYDQFGRVSAQKLDGVTLATPQYDGRSDLASVTYGNGTKLAAIERDGAGRTTGLTWQRPDLTTLASDVVTRTVGGDVVDQVVDGVDANPSGRNYKYDAANRLEEGIQM